MKFTDFYHSYLKEEEAGNITRRKHPENEDLVILDYTERCKFQENWNPINEQCRDLIVNEATGEIVARSFSKFYSQYQRPYVNSTYIKNTYPESTIEVLEKLDGIQAVSYRINDKLRFASEGRFTSKSARLAEDIWNFSYAHVEPILPDEITLTVEVIHPELRVVVPYDFEDLILVGAKNRHTGYDFNFTELQQLALTLGMKVPASYPLSFEEACKFANTLPYSSEGFVVRYGNDQRIKVKASEYLRVFRLTHTMSNKQWTKLWLHDEIDTHIKSLPVEFRQRFIDFGSALLAESLELMRHLHDLYTRAPKQTKKEYALWINENTTKHRRLLFKMFDGTLSDFDLKLAVYHERFSNND